MRQKQRWGDALRIVRAARKQTQVTIARGAGISAGHLNMIEGGHRVPSTATLEALCDELWIPVAMMARIAENPEKALGIEAVA
ncbi:MAG: helix-turn-helix transcriptional regulator [Acidobacteria bacterium]|nr:helix-turn-helix transcriptional regulator [Acidobacteriota bacterium]